MISTGIVGGVANAVSGGRLDGKVKKQKVNLQNSIPCAVEQTKVYLGSTAQRALTIGTAAGAVYATAKVPAFAKQVAKLGSKIANTKIGSTLVSGLGKIGDKFLNAETLSKIKNAPTWMKLAAALVLPALAIKETIDLKEMYNHGKVQQKYEDKSAIQNAMSEII